MATGIVSPSVGMGQSVTGTPAGGGSPLRALKVVPSWVRSTVTQGINQTYMLNIQLIELLGSDADYHILIDEVQLDIDDTTLNNTDRHLPVWATENRVKFKAVPYDSSTSTTIAQTGWIEVSINGYLVARLSPKHSIHPNSTGLDFGGTITSSGSKWCGVSVDGGSFTTPTGTGSGLAAQAFGARIIRPQAVVTPPLNPGKSDIVAFTGGRVDVGTLGVDQTLTACTNTASALTGPEVEAATMLTTVTAIVSSPRTLAFAVDGTTCRIIDPVGKTVNNWTNTTGVTPLETCRIIGVWRGRFFLGNYDGNPTYWALSKIVRASNDAVSADLWTTGGTDPTRAFAGTASDSPGVVGSAITAFTELDNGRAFLGCASECYIFDGDPGYGGRLLRISDKSGVLGPRALAKDDEGNLFFLGPSGLYVIEAGKSTPRNVSGSRLTTLLNEIDTAATQVQLVYDSQKRTLMMFLTPRNRQDAGTHGVLETAENALWTDTMPLSFGPSAVCPIAGEAKDDRRYLIGGLDGFLRRPFKSKRDDDGNPIEFFVRYSPVETANGTRRLAIVELQGTGSVASGTATWEVRTADSASQVAEQSLDSTPFASGDWFTNKAGAQPPVRLRAGGGAVQVVVRQESASDSVSIERITGVFKDLGPRRF